MSKKFNIPLDVKVTVNGREAQEELKSIEREIQEFIDTRCGDMGVEINLDWSMKRATNE